MLDLLPLLDTWRPAASGRRCAVATVVGTSGSVPRPVGTSMLVSEDGEVLGSLSGGCVEGAVVESALEAMHDGGTRREFFGYSAEDAFAAGLTCGGGLEIHIEPLGPGPGRLRLESLHGLTGRPPASGAALIRRVDAGGGGAVVVPDPAAFQVLQSAELAALLGAELPGTPGSAGAGRMLPAAAAQLEPLLRGGRTGLVRLAPAGDCQPEPVSLLVESRLPAARLLIFGANDFGAALLPAAKLLGFHVTVCDARPAFAQQDRFSDRGRGGHGLAAPVPGGPGAGRPHRRPDGHLRAHARSQIRCPAPAGRAQPGRGLCRRHGVQAQPPRADRCPAAGRCGRWGPGPAALTHRPGPRRRHPGRGRGLHRGRTRGQPEQGRRPGPGQRVPEGCQRPHSPLRPQPSRQQSSRQQRRHVGSVRRPQWT